MKISLFAEGVFDLSKALLLSLASFILKLVYKIFYQRPQC